MMDPDPYGSETFVWIRMRNKSLRIRNTGFITEKRHQKIKKNVNRAKRLVFCLMFFFICLFKLH